MGKKDVKWRARPGFMLTEEKRQITGFYLHIQDAGQEDGSLWYTQ
jgi:hypothetical protein